MGKQKWYVVWKGKSPGIYTDWDTCKEQVHGFVGAQYKSFKSKSEAENAYNESYKDTISTPKVKAPSLFDSINYTQNSISVDAACSGNPGKMEYQGVWTDSKDPIFKSPVYPVGTNNIGEFLAIVDGLKFLSTHNDPHTIIYTDSKTAMAWIKHKKVKTNLERFPETEALWLAIEDAEDYIKRYPITREIKKWETDDWGEIHADFGRK